MDILYLPHNIYERVCVVINATMEILLWDFESYGIIFMVMCV
jgi:hypothetical protein